MAGCGKTQIANGMLESNRKKMRKIIHLLMYQLLSTTIQILM
jgi:hypothetical protein